MADHLLSLPLSGRELEYHDTFFSNPQKREAYLAQRAQGIRAFFETYRGGESVEIVQRRALEAGWTRAGLPRYAWDDVVVSEGLPITRPSTSASNVRVDSIPRPPSPPATRAQSLPRTPPQLQRHQPFHTSPSTSPQPLHPAQAAHQPVEEQVRTGVEEILVRLLAQELQPILKALEELRQTQQSLKSSIEKIPTVEHLEERRKVEQEQHERDREEERAFLEERFAGLEKLVGGGSSSADGESKKRQSSALEVEQKAEGEDQKPGGEEMAKLVESTSVVGTSKLMVAAAPHVAKSTSKIPRRSTMFASRDLNLPLSTPKHLTSTPAPSKTASKPSRTSQSTRTSATAQKKPTTASTRRLTLLGPETLAKIIDENRPSSLPSASVVKIDRGAVKKSPRRSTPALAAKHLPTSSRPKRASVVAAAPRIVPPGPASSFSKPTLPPRPTAFKRTLHSSVEKVRVRAARSTRELTEVTEMERGKEKGRRGRPS